MALTVDLAAKRVLVDSHPVRLTPTQWHLLEVLVRHPDQVVGHSPPLARSGGRGTTSSVSPCGCTSPPSGARLEREPGAPRHLVTEAGFGYRFVQSGRR